MSTIRVLGHFYPWNRFFQAMWEYTLGTNLSAVLKALNPLDENSTCVRICGYTLEIIPLNVLFFYLLQEINNLEIHVITHTGKKAFRCSEFSHSFRGVAYANEDTHLGKPFECALCSRSFLRKFSLHFHVITHAGGNPFYCSECSLSFRRKSHLREHLRIHTRENSLCVLYVLNHLQ
jgi:hypothetical protein